VFGLPPLRSVSLPSPGAIPGSPWEHQAPRVGEAVARGEAEIGLQPISELIEVEGIDLVGPLPAELQSSDLVYVAGAPYVSEQPIAANALIDFLADPKGGDGVQGQGPATWLTRRSSGPPSNRPAASLLPQKSVRTGLPAGGRWIRTIGPPSGSQKEFG
jgi:hypothetical protein